MSSNPITLRLPDDLRERLEMSRLVAGERSPAIAIRRHLRQSLFREDVDDRLVKLIQDRVAAPADLVAQYGRASQATIQAVNAHQTDMKAIRADIDRLLKACLWLRQDFSPKLTRQALLMCAGLFLGVVGGVIGALIFIVFLQR